MLATLLRSLRRHFGIVVVIVGGAVIATAPLAIGNDGIVRYDSLDSVLRNGERDKAKYSLYGPLAAAPLWYLGDAIGYPEEAVWVFNRVALIAAAAGLWAVLRGLLPQDERLRFLVLLFLGSMFPWHVTGFFAEVFHVTCVGLGLALLAVCRGWWAFLGSVLCVWGTANVPASTVGLALAVGVLCWHHRRLRYLLLPALAAGLILLENVARRGDPFASGYEGEAGYRTALPYSGRPGFSYPLLFGLLSVLFSFGKGLLFFAPGLFAPYPEEPHPREADVRLLYRLWMAVVVGLVAVYARWWAWYGGAVWGPRFFLFAALPAALVLARRSACAEQHSTGANVLVLLALALSSWVGANGLVFQGLDSGRYWDNHFELEYLTWYVPECSVLWQPFVFPVELETEHYFQFAAFALGFAYLAAPVVRVLAMRAARACAHAWDTFRTGPGWRF